MTTTKPMPWRDLYLTIALAVARDGMPVPHRVSGRRRDEDSYSYPLLLLRTQTRSDRDLWAALMTDRELTIDSAGEADLHAQWHGWRVLITADEPEPVSPAPAADDLSRTVVDAIEAGAR